MTNNIADYTKLGCTCGACGKLISSTESLCKDCEKELLRSETVWSDEESDE